MGADGPRFRGRSAPDIRSRLGGMGVGLVVAGLAMVAAAALNQRGQPVGHALVVEVRGDVPKPGYYGLDQPTVSSAVQAAGGDAQGMVDAALQSGTRVVVEEGTVRLEPMDELLVFGLPLDLNTASAVALEALPGVGPQRAQAMVAYREEHGPFGSVADLQRVHGIGPVTASTLEPFVVISPGQ